jgi:DNA-binding IclR family transcriptional regulator
MAILDYMAAVRSPVTISELSKALAIPKTSVFGLVHTLVGGRYVEVDDRERKTFRLGFKLFQTGIAYLANIDLHHLAHPMLRSLMTRLGETVHLATEDDGSLVFLDSVEAEGSVIRSVARLGRSNSPMYCSGLGKALLAALPDHELIRRYRGAVFAQKTPYSIATFNELMDEIRLTRQRGYAVDEMESNEQQFCVACPVYDRSRRVVASISCSAPVQRIGRKAEIAEAVTTTAISLSQRLGFLGTRFYAELG